MQAARRPATCDEVQAGFGRSGTFFAFEHYGVVPDLICCGKGISRSLPPSAIIGWPELLDQHGPSDPTNTHGGNPVCAAAAPAGLKKIRSEGLVERARLTGEILHAGLAEIAARHADVVGAVMGRGLVAGLHRVKPGGDQPDGELAFATVEQAFRKGPLMFAPVGLGAATVKICPPLTIALEKIRDGLGALAAAAAWPLSSGATGRMPRSCSSPPVRRSAPPRAGARPSGSPSPAGGPTRFAPRKG